MSKLKICPECTIANKESTQTEHDENNNCLACDERETDPSPQKLFVDRWNQFKQRSGGISNRGKRHIFTYYSGQEGTEDLLEDIVLLDCNHAEFTIEEWENMDEDEKESDAVEELDRYAGLVLVIYYR